MSNAKFSLFCGIQPNKTNLSMAYLRLQKFAVQIEQSSVDYFDRLEQCFWLYLIWWLIWLNRWICSLPWNQLWCRRCVFVCLKWFVVTSVGDLSLSFDLWPPEWLSQYLSEGLKLSERYFFRRWEHGEIWNLSAAPASPRRSAHFKTGIGPKPQPYQAISQWHQAHQQHFQLRHMP